MTSEEKKKMLTKQLSDLAGIDFEIKDTSLSDEEAIAKLKEMIVRLNVLDSKNSFLRAYLTGEMPYSDASAYIHRFHIDEEGIFQLFYLENQGDCSKESAALIKSLLPDSHDTAIEIDAKHMALVINYNDEPKDNEITQFCNELLDMLESEAFTAFKISYDKSMGKFSELPTEFNNSVLAMHIGKIFQNSDRIYAYNSLGLGRLLYNISDNEVETYFNNHINIDILSDLDAETLNILDTFFNNDLSIAETARQLYIHRNTLIYRLDKFADLTGFDVRKFSDAINVKISLMLYNYIRNSK